MQNHVYLFLGLLEVKRFMEGKITTLHDKISGFEKRVDQMAFRKQLAAKTERPDQLVRWIDAISTAEDYNRARYDRLESTRLFGGPIDCLIRMHTSGCRTLR